jgi:CheY-like chemotaxis protein
VRHVIVVEDDEHNAVLFRKLLEKRAGCRVTTTEDPAEVVALLRAEPIALVVLDVSLRRSSWNGRPVGGIEVCRLIQDTTKGRVPVLLATAHAMRGDEEALLAESGADGYIAKPIIDHAMFTTLALQLMERGERGEPGEPRDPGERAA